MAMSSRGKGPVCLPCSSEWYKATGSRLATNVACDAVVLMLRVKLAGKSRYDATGLNSSHAYVKHEFVSSRRGASILSSVDHAGVAHLGAGAHITGQARVCECASVSRWGTMEWIRPREACVVSCCMCGVICVFGRGDRNLVGLEKLPPDGLACRDKQPSRQKNRQSDKHQTSKGSQAGGRAGR